MILACAATIMINLTKVPWTKFDLETKDRAITRCAERYDDCLKKFIKKEVGSYYAICGGKDDIQNTEK
jgi:hypothetical protein